MMQLLEQPLLVGGFVVAMGLALATTTVINLLRRHRSGRGPTSRRLCRALRVGPAEQRLLERVARRVGAPGAGSLLLSSGYFDWAIARAAVTTAQTKRLATVRQRVFK